MKNIEEYFKKLGSSEAVFNPIITYPGDWYFWLTNLKKFSKEENGKNLFDDFYDRTYKQPIKDHLGFVPPFESLMVSTESPNGIGRVLKYSLEDFALQIVKFLSSAVCEYGFTKEEIILRRRNFIELIRKSTDELWSGLSIELQEKAKKLQDVLNREIQSDYFDAATYDYNTSCVSIDFRKYLELELDLTKKLQKNINNLGDFFDRELPYKELYDCFDSETFYLLFARIILDYNLFREEEDHSLDNSYSYLAYYREGLREVSKDNKKYNPTLNGYVVRKYPFGFVGRSERFNKWNYMNEFDSLMKRHPEAKKITLPSIDDKDAMMYRDQKLIAKLMELRNKEASVSWDMLPKGEVIKKATVSSNVVTKNSRNSKSLEESILEVNERIDFFEGTEVLCRIKGLDTFTGYYAFVYANGSVVLEKFWDNEEGLVPASYSATYIMNIDNFISMSKMSKIDLIEYMKLLPDSGVKRVYHTGNEKWKKSIIEEISGVYRLEDAISFIDGLEIGDIKNGK